MSNCLLLIDKKCLDLMVKCNLSQYLFVWGFIVSRNFTQEVLYSTFSTNEGKIWPIWLKIHQDVWKTKMKESILQKIKEHFSSISLSSIQFQGCEIRKFQKHFWRCFHTPDTTAFTSFNTFESFKLLISPSIQRDEKRWKIPSLKSSFSISSTKNKVSNF